MFGDLQVKKIMEESVTKKFVHEDSGSVTLLCGEYSKILYIVDFHTGLQSTRPQPVNQTMVLTLCPNPML